MPGAETFTFTKLFFGIVLSVTKSASINESKVLIIGLIYKPVILQSFLISYLFIIIPFLIINGILTGSLIIDQVVWYNNMENLGLRIGTIPIEDFFYGFTLLLSPIILSEKI